MSSTVTGSIDDNTQTIRDISSNSKDALHVNQLPNNDTIELPYKTTGRISENADDLWDSSEYDIMTYTINSDETFYAYLQVDLTVDVYLMYFKGTTYSDIDDAVVEFFDNGYSSSIYDIAVVEFGGAEISVTPNSKTTAQIAIFSVSYDSFSVDYTLYTSTPGGERSLAYSNSDEVSENLDDNIDEYEYSYFDFVLNAGETLQVMLEIDGAIELYVMICSADTEESIILTMNKWRESAVSNGIYKIEYTQNGHASYSYQASSRMNATIAIFSPQIESYTDIGFTLYSSLPSGFRAEPEPPATGGNPLGTLIVLILIVGVIVYVARRQSKKDKIQPRSHTPYQDRRIYYPGYSAKPPSQQSNYPDDQNYQDYNPQPVRTPGKFCSTCGTPNKDQGLFCSQCGSKIT
ncbi:MAG: zinc ribbon domain-containing protein [Candidatus Kariarchaeaceae archaeon]